MTSVKVAITLEQETLRQIDSLVARRVFPNRSRAIQTALREKMDRVEGNRLADGWRRLLRVARCLPVVAEHAIPGEV